MSKGFPIDSDLEHVVWVEMLQLTKWIADTIMAVMRALQIEYEYKNRRMKCEVELRINFFLIENKIKIKLNDILMSFTSRISYIPRTLED